MATIPPPNVWVDAPPKIENSPITPPNTPMPWCDRCQGYHHAMAECIAPTEPAINTVGDYIRVHALHVVITIPGLLEMPVGMVQVEHDELAQLTYVTQQDRVLGTAAWNAGEDPGPEAFRRRSA